MPMYPGFVGTSAASQSVIANCERLMNWFPEAVQSAAAPTQMALYPTPGQGPFATTGDIGGRGAFYANGRAFMVIGTGFYEVFSNETVTLRGSVDEDAYPATISYNGVSGGQLFITSGGNGYCYVLASNTLTTVLTGTATMGGMLNSRFLAFCRDDGRVRFSALNDGTSWDATDYFARSAAADPWVSMIVWGTRIVLIGEHTGEVWYDAGGFPLPYQLIQGSVFQDGTAAPFSVAAAGEYLVWLSQDKNGSGSIVAARGYSPQAISTPAVENAMATYQRESTIEDCETLVYSHAGHTFACFSFPTAGATWCVDVKMNMAWHERGSFNSATGQYGVWSPRVHMSAFGKHLVGNRNSGAIGDLDAEFGSELDGAVIRRLRIPPPLWAQPNQRLQIDSLQVMVEPGLGLTTGQGSDPVLMLRTSNDAKTWGAERHASVGRLGQYTKRCTFHRLGGSDFLFVPEIVVTDPIPWKISGAFIDGTGFAASRQAG